MINSNNSSVTLGSSSIVHIEPSQSSTEIRIDVIALQYHLSQLSGQIINKDQQPMPNMLVTLVRILDPSSHSDYQFIAHTTSDACGFYSFNLYSTEESWYKIIVGKSPTGNEIII